MYFGGLKSGWEVSCRQEPSFKSKERQEKVGRRRVVFDAEV